jgi:adenylosuccinate lyase
MRASHEHRDFKELLLNDPDVMGALTQEDVRLAFDLKQQLRNVDRIFERVFKSVPASV